MSIPAKVFLIGEHSVVQGGKALLLALKPPFVYQKKIQAKDFHPDSPVGAYLKDSAQHVSFELSSPGLGPGFGSSTAELIACVALLHDVLPEGEPIWQWYKKRFPRASGADFAAQLNALQTGLPLFEVSPGHVEPKSGLESLAEQILLFQSPSEQKKNTHDSLKDLKPDQNNSLDLAYLDRLVAQVSQAFASSQINSLSVLNDFAEHLSDRGFESAFAKKVRLALRVNPGVLAVKGCGAQMNDVFLVVVKDASKASIEPVLKSAKDFNLKFLGTVSEHQW